MTEDRLRLEIAAAAARLVAEDGFDFAVAKVKAAQRLLGQGRHAHESMPDDDELLEAVREYQRLFQADTQPLRLRAMREAALAVMNTLPEFELTVVGAVANGTAGEHSEIYLQCFADSSKDLHIALLNAGIEADADELDNPFGRGRVERLTFILHDEAVNITCYPPNKARQIGDQVRERLTRQALERVLDEPETHASKEHDR
jgi:hypothetical protein